MRENPAPGGRLRVLAVDDDPDLLRILRMGLGSRGIDLETVGSGEDALKAVQGNSFDMVLLDVRLPGINGFQVLMQIREAGDATPVMMITALNAEDDVVRGLEAGADGYITKPFRVRELAARIEALHRRTRFARTRALTLGDLELDERERTVSRRGKALHLTNIEFRLLACLMRNAPRTVSRPTLLEEVWGMDFDPGTGIVDVHIGNVRKKLRQAGPPLIETVRGSGFRIPHPSEG